MCRDGRGTVNNEDRIVTEQSGLLDVLDPCEQNAMQHHEMQKYATRNQEGRPYTQNGDCILESSASGRILHKQVNVSSKCSTVAKRARGCINGRS